MPNKLEQQVTRHEREIAAIRKLILTGMKMIVRNDRQIDKLTAEGREVRAAQRETDRMLKSLITSLGRGRNGHSKN